MEGPFLKLPPSSQEGKEIMMRQYLLFLSLFVVVAHSHPHGWGWGDGDKKLVAPVVVPALTSATFIGGEDVTRTYIRESLPSYTPIAPAVPMRPLPMPLWAQDSILEGFNMHHYQPLIHTEEVLRPLLPEEDGRWVDDVTVLKKVVEPVAVLPEDDGQWVPDTLPVHHMTWPVVKPEVVLPRPVVSAALVEDEGQWVPDTLPVHHLKWPVVRPEVVLPRPVVSAALVEDEGQWVDDTLAYDPVVPVKSWYDDEGRWIDDTSFWQTYSYAPAAPVVVPVEEGQWVDDTLAYDRMVPVALPEDDGQWVNDVSLYAPSHRFFDWQGFEPMPMTPVVPVPAISPAIPYPQHHYEEWVEEPGHVVTVSEPIHISFSSERMIPMAPMAPLAPLAPLAPVYHGVSHLLPSGNFNYKSLTRDGTFMAGEGRLKNVEGSPVSVMSGTYSSKDVNGKSYITKWVADEKGFRAEGDHLPKPPKMTMTTTTTPKPHGHGWGWNSSK